MARLDVGGKMLYFEDHEGRRELFVEILNAVLESLPEARAQGNVDTAALVDASGLTQAAASGRSVRKDGESWLMRGFTYYPDGPGGLTDLLGKESVPFESPGLLPAATDLLLETRLDATRVPALFLRIARACGQEATAQQALTEPLPVGGDMGSLLAKADLHLTVGIDVSSWNEKKPMLQPVDYFVQIGGGKDLLAVLLPEIEKALGSPTAVGKRQGWEVPLPAIGMDAKAVLVYDDAGTVVCASRMEYLESVDNAPMKLGAWKEFQDATDHFPKSGNFLLYTSPQLPSVLGWAIRQAANASGKEEASVIAKATSYLQPRSLAICVAREADGMALTAEMPFAAETNLGATLPVLTATSTLFVGARAWKKGSDRAACILNVRNIQQAIRGYQGMNSLNIGDPIPWDKIIGEGAFLKNWPICGAGGTYIYTKTVPAVGKLACECPVAEHAVPNHADW